MHAWIYDLKGGWSQNVVESKIDANWIMAIAVSDWPYKLLTPYFFKGIYADRVSNVRMKIVPSINNEGKKKLW